MNDNKPILIVIGSGSTSTEILEILDNLADDTRVIFNDDFDVRQHNQDIIDRIMPFHKEDMLRIEPFLIDDLPYNEPEPPKIIKTHYKGSIKGQNRHQRINYNKQNHRRR